MVLGGAVTLVCPFLGAGPPWLDTLAPGLEPPVAWMGGKRRFSGDLLALLDLRPGCRCPALLGDLSWWGWVWPVVLDPVEGARTCEVLRSWGGEDPRALWFRLRDQGPIDREADPGAAAAQLLWLQARAASGVPVWWEGESAVQWASTKIDADGQRQATEPRLLASDGRGDPRVTGQRTERPDPLTCDRNPPGVARGGGIVRTATVAERLEAIRAHLVKGSGGPAGFGYDHGIRIRHGWRPFVPNDVAGRLDAIRTSSGALPHIEHASAADLTARWASVLGGDAAVYLDPPYQGATGYPAACPRDEVLAIARTWAAHGARVVLSERVPLNGELGDGWSAVQLRGGQRPEWVTTYGCDVARFRAERPRVVQVDLFAGAS